MAGIPRAPTTIVDPNTIVRMRQRDDKYNMLSLLPEIADTDASVSWLAERGLIGNTFTCAICQQPCRMNAYAGSADGYRWKCRDCNFRKSIRHGSFFSDSHLSLKQVILMI